MDLGKHVLKQKIMRRVLISLIPLVLFSVFLFGWRMLALLFIVCLVGILSEYAAMRLINGPEAKVSEAVLVSCFLFTLTLPPSTPWWIAAVGIAFGVFFGKGVFGGFGRNIFNPALVGRCFIYVSFPVYLTASWSAPFLTLPGGFASFGGIDVVAAATPMALLKDTGAITGYWQLFLGTISGSAGETSALLILAAAVYLLVTKTASWRIMLSCALTFIVVSTLLYWLDISQADPLFALLSGGFLFGAVFMATDPVSAPGDKLAQVLYGVLIAAATLLIRTYSLFTEGVMFAILLANTFAPLLDRQIKALKAGKKVAAG
jgi:Na+-transporting NADH:ubiquinone oxidoreductase subunit B